MKVKEMNRFIRIITFGFAAAITLSPFGIYVRKSYMGDFQMIRHEMIHWKQQLEMGIIFFYIWYFIEWLVRLFVNWGNAYYSISFERESNSNEKNVNYLKTRKHFAWFQYLHK
jgi:hypothetical protein